MHFTINESACSGFHSFDEVFRDAREPGCWPGPFRVNESDQLDVAFIDCAHLSPFT